MLGIKLIDMNQKGHNASRHSLVIVSVGYCGQQGYDTVGIPNFTLLM